MSMPKMPRTETWKMIVYAIRHYRNHFAHMTAADLAEEEDVVARKVAWQLLASEAVYPALWGAKMIRHVDGYLLPPASAHYWTGPTPDEKESAPFLTSWAVAVTPLVGVPARWELGGGTWIFPCGNTTRRWEPLISITTDRLWARCTQGWVHLGQRFHS